LHLGIAAYFLAYPVRSIYFVKEIFYRNGAGLAKKPLEITMLQTRHQCLFTTNRAGSPDERARKSGAKSGRRCFGAPVDHGRRAANVALAGPSTEIVQQVVAQMVLVNILEYSTAHKPVAVRVSENLAARMQWRPIEPPACLCIPINAWCDRELLPQLVAKLFWGQSRMLDQMKARTECDRQAKSVRMAFAFDGENAVVG
jgi:hypothetical protein